MLVSYKSYEQFFKLSVIWNNVDSFFSGQKFSEKVENLRTQLEVKNVVGIVVNALDDVACQSLVL